MRHILVVDDEIFIRKGLKAMIERASTCFGDILECGNGREALDILGKNEIDLVITDIKMPHMDGVEFMKAARNLAYKPKFIILSGYDDFSYAKAALKYGANEYLLKPVQREELLEALLKVEKEILKDESLADGINMMNSAIHQFYINELNYILLNEKLTAKEIANILDSIKLDIFKGCFNISIVAACKAGDEAERGIFAYVKGIINACFGKDCGDIISFPNPAGQVCVVTSSEEKYAKLVGHFRKDGKNEYIMACSHWGKSEKDVRNSYLQALEALKHNMVSNGARVILYEDVARLNTTYKLPLEKIKKIADLIGSEKKSEISLLIEQLFESRTISQNHVGYIERIIENINKHVIERYYEYIPLSENIIHKEREEIKSLYHYKCKDDYVKALKNFLLYLNDFIFAVKNEKAVINDIDKVILWIRENFAQADITMSMAANHISRNYSYFSYSFKDRVGLSFIEYLKKVRIEKAKELLLQTDDKVHEIAIRVGFNNPRHFATSFREIVGYTPLEYRRMTLICHQE